eukprot:15188-Heterococcus_DN1.PRE.2
MNMVSPVTWQTAVLRGAAYCCYSSQCVMEVCAGCVADDLQLQHAASCNISSFLHNAACVHTHILTSFASIAAQSSLPICINTSRFNNKHGITTHLCHDADQVQFLAEPPCCGTLQAAGASVFDVTLCPIVVDARCEKLSVYMSAVHA